MASIFCKVNMQWKLECILLLLNKSVTLCKIIDKDKFITYNLVYIDIISLVYK